MMVVKDTHSMISQMQPQLRPGHWVFRSFADPRDAETLLAQALASFREDEGLSLILPDDGTGEMAMRCITLHVQSALDGVGLTAAVAAALAEAGIPCNMVAAYHHDHVFVPSDMAQLALRVLLQRAAAEDTDETAGQP